MAKTKLDVKDLINVGIFCLLYLAVIAVLGQLGALIPIGQVLGPLYIPFVAGIVFVLFLTRVKKFGMVSLLGIIVGLLILVTGQSYWVAIFAVILAPLADLILRAGKYRSWKLSVLGYVVFSEILIGTVVPLFFAREAFLERILARHDPTWVQSLVDMTPQWMFIVMAAMLAAGAWGGIYLGRAMLRKHFERAGIA